MSKTSKPVKVLVLHHIGGNATAMRKRMAPILDQLPEQSRFEFFFAEAPYVVSDLESVPLDGKSQLRLQSTSKGIVGEQTQKNSGKEAVAAFNDALRLVNIKRAVAAEATSEKTRLYKRSRHNFALSTQTTDQLAGRLELQKLEPLASEVVDQPSPSSKQARMWLIHADGATKGGWIGHEHALQTVAGIMLRYGPFDGLVGFSAGAMIGSYCQSFLSQSQRADEWEPLFTPPVDQSAFKFCLLFSPFFPLFPRCQAYINGAGRAGAKTLVVGGEKDPVVPMDMLDTFARNVRAEGIWTHPGAHTIPSDVGMARKLADWLYEAATSTSSSKSLHPVTPRDPAISARL